MNTDHPQLQKFHSTFTPKRTLAVIAEAHKASSPDDFVQFSKQVEAHEKAIKQQRVGSVQWIQMNQTHANLSRQHTDAAVEVEGSVHRVWQSDSAAIAIARDLEDLRTEMTKAADKIEKAEREMFEKNGWAFEVSQAAAPLREHLAKHVEAAITYYGRGLELERGQRPVMSQVAWILCRKSWREVQA